MATRFGIRSGFMKFGKSAMEAMSKTWQAVTQGSGTRGRGKAIVEGQRRTSHQQQQRELTKVEVTAERLRGIIDGTAPAYKTADAAKEIADEIGDFLLAHARKGGQASKLSESDVVQLEKYSLKLKRTIAQVSLSHKLGEGLLGDAKAQVSTLKNDHLAPRQLTAAGVKLNALNQNLSKLQDRLTNIKEKVDVLVKEAKYQKGKAAKEVADKPTSHTPDVENVQEAGVATSSTTFTITMGGTGG